MSRRSRVQCSPATHRLLYLQSSISNPFAMVHVVGFLLIALAAGFRSKSDPASPWDEHRVSSAEELQELLRTALAEANTAEATGEDPSDAVAQEEMLREQVALIMKDWQSASAGACHQQLGLLMNNLMFACESSHPKADWILAYYNDVLPEKTCAESVSDIFALGNELVETFHVSRDAVASFDVDGKTLGRYQALSFLRSWLVDLTKTAQHALLWAGFWDGDPENRTMQTALSNFAREIEHAKVHPNTFLGRAIEASQDLGACYEDAQTSALAANMWSIASMSFVLGMRDRAHGTVIALVNKQVTGERNLSQSVLSTHEIPTVGIAAWGLGFWSPKVMVVDLMGTGERNLSQSVLSTHEIPTVGIAAWGLGFWSPKVMVNDELEPGSLRDEAKEEQDRKDQELREEARRREEGSEMQTAEELLRQHADPNAMDRLGHTALSYAANKGDLQLVQPLLDAGAQLEARDELGFTALIMAAQEGHLKVVEALLTAGAQLEARSNQGTTALRKAANRGQLQVIAASAKARAKLEARDEAGDTALTAAAYSDHAKVVEALVEAGAQLEARSKQGKTALAIAAEQGLPKVVEALVKAGAQLEACDVHGLTALMSAAYFDHAKVVEALVEAGAQLEARSKQGKTALAIAAEQGLPKVVEALVKAGAQLEAREEHGFTALIMAAQRGRLKVVEVLVKAGAQLDARNMYGETALMVASMYGRSEVSEALRKAGAQLSSPRASSAPPRARLVARDGSEGRVTVSRGSVLLVSSAGAARSSRRETPGTRRPSADSDVEIVPRTLLVPRAEPAAQVSRPASKVVQLTAAQTPPPPRTVRRNGSREQEPGVHPAQEQERKEHQSAALRSEVLRFKQEREAFQEEMEQMLQTARERKAREDALALEVEAYEKKKAEVHQRQQNLLDQRAELERRREEIKNQEMEMRKEEQRLQAISADLGHEAKEHADRSNILRREKEEFQQRSSDMLRRQKAREMACCQGPEIERSETKAAEKPTSTTARRGRRVAPRKPASEFQDTATEICLTCHAKLQDGSTRL
eukprot:s335_g2.t1